MSYTSAGYNIYASWCRACGGTPSNVGGMSCTPGSHWGASTYSGSLSSGGNHLRPEQQIMLNVGSNLLRDMVQDFFTFGDSPEEEAAKAARAEQLRREAIERERLRQERESQQKEASYQKLSKELKGLPSDSERLGLKDKNDSRLSFKRDEGEAKPLLPKTECTEAKNKLMELEGHGLKIFDEQIQKTQKIIEEAQLARKKVKEENTKVAAEYAAGLAMDRLKDFATSVQTIRKLKTQILSLPLDPKESLKLKKWAEAGIASGNGVIDATEKAQAAQAFNFSEPDSKQGKRKQLLKAIGEFNSKFMADTGAWELAGETLASGLGPAGPFAFKTSVLGIKSAANFASQKIDENEVNEQRLHLGNMQKTRAQLVQKINTLKSELENQCR